MKMKLTSPPIGFAFCDEPWQPDEKHGMAICWDENSGYEVAGAEEDLTGTPCRWIRPAGVPVDLLRSLIDVAIGHAAEDKDWLADLTAFCDKYESGGK